MHYDRDYLILGAWMTGAVVAAIAAATAVVWGAAKLLGWI